jgi:MSHA biogenesis protein MshP
MFRDRRPRHSQSGFALVAAIFLLVVLSMLAAFATYFVSVQSNTVVLDQRGAQALAAANTGLEIAAWQVLRNGNTCVNTTTLPVGTLADTLAPFTVTLRCSSETHPDDGTGVPVTLYTLTATASAGTLGRDYVERQVSGLLKN